MTKEKPSLGNLLNRSVRAQSRRQGADAADLAARTLAFLAGDPERLADFMALTGLTPASLRAAATEPGFERGILAYLAGHEDLILGLAAQEETDPALLAQAIQGAIGGDWDGS